MKLRDRQIEVFQAIMECGTLTAAAERLCISQPSVSRILSRFEQVSGFKSFELQGRRLVPTESAKIFYQEVLKIQKGMRHLNHVAEEIKNFKKGYISIGILPALSNSWIIDIIDEFITSYPDIQLSLLRKFSKDIAESIEMQRIDIGISLIKSDSESVHSQKLYDLESLCVLPTEHPLSKKKTITIDDLQGERFIELLDDEQGPTIKFEDSYLSSSLKNTAYLKTNSALTACHMVAKNQGISIVPSIVAEEHSHLDIVTRKVDAIKSKPVYLLTSTNNHYSPIIDLFEKLLLSKYQ